MLQSWRLKLREAEQAYKAERLEEARDLLARDGLSEFLPAKRLMGKLARGFVERGTRRAQGGESSAGWRDLQAALGLGADNDAVARLRKLLVEQALAEAEGYVAAGEAREALQRLERVERRSAGNSRLRVLKQVAAKLDVAERLGREGRFGQAEETMATAAALRPDIKRLGELRQLFRQRQVEAHGLREQLFEALGSERWQQVVDLADRLLQIAPEDAVARDAQSRAWAAVGTEVKQRRAKLPLPRPRYPEAQPQVTMNGNGKAQPQGRRFLLWIDGVGGYLVCEGPQVVLGQPVPGSPADVPILGDVSRNHATIRRSGEGYLIDPRRPVQIDGKPIAAVTSLADGNLIELGTGGVKLRFRRPHPLSGTARLEFASRHRTQPAVDAVLLMADSCILGPGPRSHVVCHDWPHEVVLSRREEELYCRAEGTFEIDGCACQGQGPVNRNAQLAGESFSIKLEEL